MSTKGMAIKVKVEVDTKFEVEEVEETLEEDVVKDDTIYLTARNKTTSVQISR
jgi:hypothetical protein